MKLSILIPTIEGRGAMLHFLLKKLIRISGPYHGSIEILCCLDNKETTIGAKRQHLLENSRGEYVVFIDDDDEVAEDYFTHVMPVLDEFPDCVGYCERVMVNGLIEKKSIISNRFNDWSDTPSHFERTIFYKVPIRRQLALKAGFNRSLSFGEDHDFAKRLKPHLLGREIFIDKMLYYYTSNSGQTNAERYGAKQHSQTESLAYCRLFPNPTLFTIHNAGLFSNLTVRAVDIMRYSKHLLGEFDVDSSRQFKWYGNLKPEDLFEKPRYSKVNRLLNFDSQFMRYKDLPFEELNQTLIGNYFLTTDPIYERCMGFIRKYKIHTANTCAVFYRGNDKVRETAIAPYGEFIAQCETVPEDMKFLVLPDEKEFAEAMVNRFGDRVIIPDELMSARKNNNVVMPRIIPEDERRQHGIDFFTFVFIASRCHTLITHSGNGGLWCAIYRGNSNNLKQYLNGKWS